MKKVAILLMILLVATTTMAAAGNDASGCGPSSNPLDLFASGNSLYLKGEFEAALLCYEEASQNGMRTGDLLFNMGNSYFKLGKLGLAILYYNKAEKYIPSDRDLAYNLEYAVSLTRDKSSPLMLKESIAELVQLLPPRSILYLFSGFNFLFWLLIAIWQFSGRRSFLFLCLFPLLVCILLTPGLFFREKIVSRKGVALEKELSVKSSPGESGTELFVLHEGFVIAIKDEEGDWVRISAGEKKQGWVKKKSIARI